ncbi:type VI secretion system accessory protein TagJ [Lichenicola cladoniae]|nr:type VI secretion system accessory protein TagJ [Lichenicola cladoniae]
MCAAQNDAGASNEAADMSNKPGSLFRAGHLEAAITAANDSVRRAPAVMEHRMLLAELLLFAGRFERADTVLAAAETIDPSLMLVASEFRHLLRAEIARQQTWNEGRVPEFVGEPTESLSLSLKALTLLREGDEAGAAQAAQQAEAVRPHVGGQHEDALFDDFRDADDICAGFIEVLTVTGRYFWMPTERIEEAIFHPARRPRDLFWRRCSMTVRAGPDGDVYVPAIYAGGPTTASSPGEADADTLRLGKSTEWSGETLVRGRGQRLFLAGEDGLAIQDLVSLTFG